MIDNKFTEKMQSWLNTEPAHRNLEDGALMMLQLNHNRILYNNAMRNLNKFADKIEYEIKKHLTHRLDQLTMEDVISMDKELMPRAERLVKSQSVVIDSDNDSTTEAVVAKGKRTDHDSLPEEIRRKWVDNGLIFYKIKSLFETLKGMENAQPCDRYEYLKQLGELDSLYHKNLQEYDDYKAGETIPKADSTNDPADMVKKVSAARGYISANKAKLAELKKSGDEKRFSELKAKVQERVDFLLTSGNDISEEQMTALAELGVII